MQLRYGLLIALLTLNTGCAPPSALAPGRESRASVTWADTVTHRFSGAAEYTRCGTLVHLWASPHMDRRPLHGLQVTISPFRDRADTLELNAHYGSSSKNSWAHVRLFGKGGAYIGAVAGQLVLATPRTDYISGYITGRLVRFDPINVRTDTLGELTAKFAGGRSREREKIVYQTVTCPSDDRAPPPQMRI